MAERARAYRPERFSETANRGLAERRARAVGQRRGPVTPDQVIAAAAETFGLSVADLAGPARDAEIVLPRQLAIYLIRQLCPNVSLNDIGRLLGGRDHTTVAYGEQKITRLVAAGDRDTLRDLDLVKEALGERA